MTLGERIKKLRKALDLTQQEFAKRIGTSASVLTNYETGRRNPSSSVINNICKTFDVPEKWLRNGEGEMFLAKPTAALDALAAEHDLSNGDYILIEKFLALKPEVRKVMMDFMKEVVAAITTMEGDGFLSDDPVFPFSLSHGIPCTAEEINNLTVSFHNGLIMDAKHRQQREEAKEIEELKKQNSELLARVEALEQEEMAEEIEPSLPAEESRYLSR